jgi:hypothetical protein
MGKQCEEKANGKELRQILKNLEMKGTVASRFSFHRQ